MVGSGKRHLDIRHCRLRYIVGGKHIGKTALIHHDHGLFKQSFRTQVGRKVLQECGPQISIFLRTRLSIQKFQFTGSRIEISVLGFPGNHRETLQVGIYAIFRHIVDPSVENRIIELPGAVGLTHGSHHRFKLIVALLAPWLVEQDDRHGLLSGACKLLNIGTHQIEMLFAPRLNAIVARHGIGLLPEVEIERLICTGRESTLIDIDSQRERAHRLACRFILHGQLHIILSGSYIGNLNCKPYRAHRTRSHRHSGVGQINHIRNSERRQRVRWVSAAGPRRRQDITHECGLSARSLDLALTLPQIREFQRKISRTLRTHEQSLQSETLATPCMHRGIGHHRRYGRCKLAVMRVFRHPSQMRRTGKRFPSRAIDGRSVGRFNIIFCRHGQYWHHSKYGGKASKNIHGNESCR